MEGVDRQPHIKLSKTDVHPVAVIYGDPARGEVLASLCDSAAELEFAREYRSWSCTHNGQSFTAISHGVGSSGMAVCVEELIALGVQVIIRAGTAGTLQAKHKQGDLVVCHAAVKGDGTSKLLEPEGVPAIADLEVVQQLRASAKALEVEVGTGITYSDDLFYKSKVMPSHLTTVRDAKVNVVEMECAALFTLTRHNDRRGGAIVCIDGSPFTWAGGDYDPHGTKVARGKETMLKVAMHACSMLAKEYAATDAFIMPASAKPWAGQKVTAQTTPCDSQTCAC